MKDREAMKYLEEYLIEWSRDFVKLVKKPIGIMISKDNGIITKVRIDYGEKE